MSFQLVAAPLTPSPSVPVSPRRVLVVDDDPGNATLLCRLLEHLGYATAMANSGETALAEATQFEPHAVLMDLSMPGMSGYEAARAFRQQAALAGVFLCALTGFGEDEHRERSREAGFDEHLVKPVPMDALREVLAGALGE